MNEEFSSLMYNLYPKVIVCMLLSSQTILINGSANLYRPTSGLSDVMGIIEDTVLRNMVSDRSIVTPEKEKGD